MSQIEGADSQPVEQSKARRPKISEALNIGSYPPESTGLFSAAEVKDA